MEKLSTLLLRSLFSIVGLIYSFSVFSQNNSEDKKNSRTFSDPDWSWATNRVQRKGLTTDRTPKHISPYSLQDIHTQDEMVPPYGLLKETEGQGRSDALDLLLDKAKRMKDQVFDEKAQMKHFLTLRSQESKRNFASLIESQFSKVTLIHKNKMSSDYRLARLRYVMDGETIFQISDGPRESIENISIFDGYVKPGHHRIVIQATYQGQSQGLFTYLEDYRVNITEEKDFSTDKGQRYQIVMEAHEAGRFYTSFERRPQFRMVLNQDRTPASSGQTTTGAN